METRVVLWKDSRFAALVMAVLIVFGSFFGAGRSLSKLKTQTDMAFYSGVDGDGFCLQRDLDERVISATNMITVARRYLQEDDAALSGMVNARDVLANAKGVREKYDANVMLSSKSAELVSQLEKQDVTAQDAVYIRSIPVDMQSRNDAMSRDGYNELAAKYNETLQGFPAKYFAATLKIEKAELFR